MILSVQSSVAAGKTAINVLPVGGDGNPLRDLSVSMPLRSLTHLPPFASGFDLVEFAVLDGKVLITHLYPECDGRRTRSFIAAR